jgi:subtilisin family serine protease
MSKITVNFGNGTVVLEKSKKYVGVKATATRSLGGSSALKEATKETLMPYLGGFKIISVKNQTGQRGLINSKLDGLRGLAEVESGTHVYHIAGSDKPLVPTGSIYVTFEEKVSEKQQIALLTKYNLTLKKRRGSLKVVAQVTAESANPLKCAAKLQRLKAVARAEPDIDTPLDHYEFAEPTAKLWSHMWHLDNKGTIPDSPTIHMKPGADVKAIDAWKLLDGYGNPNIVVAVIDNGIDLEHPDLQTKIVKPVTLWEGPQALDLFNNAIYTHGTPCAGVATAPNDGGSCGSAPAARLMPMSGTGFSIEITEQMFNYCIDNGADVISCSWGTIDGSFALSQEKLDVIAKAAKEGRGGKGCVVCFAAGNEGADSINVYGEHPDVICVGASTSEDEHADYSNTGSNLTVCAPSNGGNFVIIAPKASWDDETPYQFDGIDRGPLHKDFGGTSSATPLVAGVCALILSANPNLTAKEVKEILTQTADKIGEPTDYTEGHSIKFGYGRVNAGKAVQEALNRVVI